MEPEEIQTRMKKAASSAVVNHFHTSGRDKDTIKKAHASYTKQASVREGKFVEMAGAILGEEATA